MRSNSKGKLDFFNCEGCNVDPPPHLTTKRIY
jgi:hypothetical protein